MSPPRFDRVYFIPDTNSRWNNLRYRITNWCVKQRIQLYSVQWLVLSGAGAGITELVPDTCQLEGDFFFLILGRGTTRSYLVNASTLVEDEPVPKKIRRDDMIAIPLSLIRPPTIIYGHRYLSA
jgi:hypothetical protein